MLITRAIPVAGAASLLLLSASYAQLSRSGSAQDAWTMVGGGQDEQHFSALADINEKNVANLKPAWFADYDTMRGQEGEPVVVDGVMYISTAWSKVYAYNAETGKELWQYDPKVPGASAVRGCCDVVNRGVAYANGRVFIGTFDGRLAAIDAKSGKELWTVNTVDQTKNYTITGAPRVVNGKVIIGNGGAEYGVRGYVTAYDAVTGKQAWRFYTVPGEPGKLDGEVSDEPIEKLARGTWFGDTYWKGGGGGTAWDLIVYDRETNRLYIGVGNGAPHSYFKRSQAKGDNLFLASIVAVDPDTGKYIWHYQENPGDSWDYTSVQPMILADLLIGGKTRKVILHAPKNGFFYVIDRVTGKPISADAYVQDIRWAKGIDPKTWRPIDTEGNRYIDKPFLNSPGPPGGHNFQPMAYSPLTKLVYLPTSQNYWAYKPNQAPAHGAPPPSPDMPKPDNYLQAWDPVARKSVWRVQADGARLDVGGGGVLATAGNLVFQGRGEIVGEMLALRATDGKVLWRYAMPNAVMAAPVTYRIKGVQYVAVSTGAGGPVTFGSNTPPRERQVGRMVVFKLGGKATLPEPPPLAGPATPPEDSDTFTPQQVALGGGLYAANCGRCHGMGTRQSNILPDLRRSAVLASAETWQEVVIGGALTDNGMVSFASTLKPADAEAIRAWVGTESRKLAENQRAGKPER